MQFHETTNVSEKEWAEREEGNDCDGGGSSDCWLMLLACLLAADAIWNQEVISVNRTFAILEL